MNDDWILWKPSRSKIIDSVFFRYGFATTTTLLSALLIFRVPPLVEVSYFLFIGAIIVTALYAGLIAAFWSVVLSTLVIIYCFIPPYYSFSLSREISLEDSVRLVGFLLISLTTSSLVAACQRERKALRESEERYRILIETASDGIVIVDEQDVVLFANSLAGQIFSLPARRMLGQPLATYMLDSAYKKRLCEMRHHLDTRLRARPIELSGRDFNGKDLRLEMTFGSFSTCDRNVVTAIVRDISQREEALVASRDLRKFEH